MDANALTGYIRQGIRTQILEDRILLELPFFFTSAEQTPLCLNWDKDGLSDGGRTMAELEKRLGSLAPYESNIRNILKTNDLVTLESGRILAVRHFQTCVCGETQYPDYLGGLNRLLRVISLMNVVDTVTVTKDGTVVLC